jgi:hypothetical protein
MPGPRISRELAEMIDQLDRQLVLLQEFGRHAFEEHRQEYLPEVATKLRILLVRSKQNAPLLFRVADALKVEPSVVLDGPPIRPPPGEPGPGDKITLDRFFDLHAVTIRTSIGLVSMTKRELIRAWCEQLGGVHEDWEVEEALINALRTPILLGGMQPSAMELRNSMRIALEHGRRLVQLGTAAKDAS